MKVFDMELKEITYIRTWKNIFFLDMLDQVECLKYSIMTECVRLFDHPIIKVHILVLSGVDICVSWIIRPIKYPNIFQYEIKALLGAQLFDYPNILQESGWPILRRWEVPWQWQTVSLTSLACGLGFVLTGLTEAIALPYLGIKPDVLSLDDKAEILLFDQSITTAVVLGIIYSVANTFQPLPEDFFKYDLREPFNLQKGWLLWAGIGLAGAILAISLTGVAVSFFNGETPQRETDALVRLLPLIGSSNLSTACLVGITGVLAPLLEETVFRGFFMTSLTKWVPTPVAVVISAAVFALVHLTPGEFPQLFVLGTALGFSYAQTHNLLTPITIHSFWNSGVILFLTFLQLQGYDIRELLQAT